MSCLDEIGSQVVHIQWNEPPRHSKAGSTPPEKRDEKIRKTLFFGGLEWHHRKDGLPVLLFLNHHKKCVNIGLASRQKFLGSSARRLLKDSVVEVRCKIPRFSILAGGTLCVFCEPSVKEA